ncbi:MAG: hypothetical protein Q8P49_02655 [Candidatus Liptonbacteria bacterium]|nr:hypothetical protein [Candidatus Liptonbacteria bacterium]
MDLLRKETVVVVGFGWVGQANALALRNAGYPVYFYDVSTPEPRYTKYRALYAEVSGLSHVFEKESSNTWYIVCVGDRVSDDGFQDISAIRKALLPLTKARGRVILRSTVIPGHLEPLPFNYYIPEFLHEKKAVEECMKPHYFIVGKREEGLPEPSFFGVWRRSAVKVFEGTPEEASYLKYLSNIWNSVRIAFVNEFGNSIGLPTDKAQLAQNEKLINFFFEEKSYLRYGRSFGGHCLPKDTRAFYRWHKDQGRDMSLLEGVCRSNDLHRSIERKHPHLPEWFSEWVRPQISGWVALDALGASVSRKLGKVFGMSAKK